MPSGGLRLCRSPSRTLSVISQGKNRPFLARQNKLFRGRVYSSAYSISTWSAVRTAKESSKLSPPSKIHRPLRRFSSTWACQHERRLGHRLRIPLFTNSPSSRKPPPTLITAFHAMINGLARPPQRKRLLAADKSSSSRPVSVQRS